MKKKAVPPLEVNDWRVEAQFIKSWVVGARRLGVAVAHLYDAWAVMAFETASETAAIETLLDDHAHKVVGRYEGPTEAFAAAESFGAAWVKKFKATAMPPRGCDEISEAKSP